MATKVTSQVTKVAMVAHFGHPWYRWCDVSNQAPFDTSDHRELGYIVFRTLLVPSWSSEGPCWSLWVPRSGLFWATLARIWKARRLKAGLHFEA